jgi:4-amino-4-deoxy-L-arabinose transferase-like glycosyltransferase
VRPPNESKIPSAQTPAFRAPWSLFWIGLFIRVAYITFAHSYRFSLFEDHFTFGYEMGRIARALVNGYGYADPFNGHTGPTAWCPPLYPLLIAAAFKLFGVYSLKSAWVLLTLNSFFSASTALAIYEIAARCYNRRVALWSGWIWTLYPAAMQYAVRSIWEMSITAMLFAWVLVLALRMRGIGEEDRVEDPQSTRRWLLFGACWGLIALSNSTLLLFLPVCGLWVLLGAKNKVPATMRAVLSGLLFMAVIAPWMIRNYQVFHAVVPFRSNFGAELNMGNNEQANGMPWGTTISSEADVRRYTEVGEVQYAKVRGDRAKAWIRSHPARFLVLSFKRFYFFWGSVPHPADKRRFLDLVRELNYCVPSITGLLGLALSLKRRTPAAGLFAWAFALLPLTYYFVTPGARFRHPLEPLILILAVYLFQSAQPRRA